MAAEAELIDYGSSNADLTVPPADQRKLTRLQAHTAGLYAMGLTRRRIQRVLLDHLAPPGKHKDERHRIQAARRKLQKWELNPVFRDAIYAQAVTDVDLALPNVLKGVVEKAKRGRVDAARLALELTGRHNPKGEGAHTAVVVQIDGIPRPVRQIEDGEVIDQ